MKIRKTCQKFPSGFSLDAYNIGEQNESFLPSPLPQFRVGNRKQVETLFNADIDRFHRQVGIEFARLPYIFFHTGERGEVYGDFANGQAGCRFDDVRMQLTHEPFHPGKELHDLWRLSSLLQADIRFSALERNTFVRGIKIVDGGHLELTIGAGMYPEAAYGVNSSGLILGLLPARRRVLEKSLDAEKFKELIALLKHFNGKYGAGVTVCQVVHKMFGRVPTLGEAYSYIMGGAALVKTEDGKIILTLRSPGTTSVNHGINMPTSGGANFDEDGLLNLGLPLYLKTEMLREAREELGITGSSCELQPLGLVRELTRGCTADALHMIFYRGTTKEVVEVIANNPHPSRREIDRLVFAIDVKDARRLVRSPRAEEVLHHKALVALILADRAGYLS